MFKFFKKQSKEEKLQAKYEKYMAEWARLSNINRKESDALYAKAQLILEEIDALRSKEA